MSKPDNTTEIHAAVRQHYAARALNADSCCGPNSGDGKGLYSETLLNTLPTEITNFTLGCGDPITLANLQPGETVLDLGSGGGLDCFLAARQVGPNGQVIGVDMTQEMLNKARTNAARLKVTNVEFREGYLEALPVADNSVDVVISNCVINLSPDKPQVFREIFRVLKPGGRVAVSDIVTNGQLPEAVQNSLAAWGACVAGALESRHYTDGLKQAGFRAVKVQPKSDTDKALAALPVGLPFSAVVTASKTTEAEASANDTGDSTPASSTLQQTGLGVLMSRVTKLDSVDDGYEFTLMGDPAENRALVEGFIQSDAACCSTLRFEVRDIPEGVVLRLTGSLVAA